MDIQLEENQAYLRDLVRLKSTKPDFNKAPVLSGSVLILMDMQIPFQDGDFIFHMLELAKSWGIKQGISGGDFFNEAAFSFFLHDPKEKVWQAEAEEARKIAEIMKKYVPRWTMILGNHDAFLLKRLEHQFGHQDLFYLARILNGFKATDYYWCIVKDKNGTEWRITHPRNASVIHGRVPERLALKYQQNIVSGHGHLAGWSPDDSGKFLCIDAGVCCDPLKLDYTQERDSIRPRMNEGAVILKEFDGVIYPYHIMPDWADWDALKKLYDDK